MSERTSNKQLLDAIEAMPAAIATAIASVANGATAPTTITEGESDVKIDAAYKAHMALKVQDFANTKGESTVMYARRNGRGETKLAYCLGSKWTAGIKDRGLIGAVQTFDPEA